MRAAYYEAKGTARDVLKIGEVEVLAPGPGEVQVQVRASGVNPTDTKRRGLWLGREMPYPRIIPHQDGAGVIAAVGPGIPASRIGERVWLYEAQWKRPFGTAAEYVTLPARNAVRLPPGTSFAEGACLGIPAITAHYCLFHGRPLEGTVVLVTGGAGAVGFYAIQLAALAGARVITTVSNSAQEALAKSAGAHCVVNRSSDDLAQAVQDFTSGKGVSRIVEVAFGTNLEKNIELLEAGGTITTYASDAEPAPTLPFAKMMLKNISVHFALVYLATELAHAEAVAAIISALEDGKLRHSIAHRLPLEQIVEAHELVEHGHLNGKVIVEV